MPKHRKPVIVRQVALDRFLRSDSNLHKMVIDTLLNARQQWAEENPTLTPLDCPITYETIKFVSIYLRMLYQEKEGELKVNLLKNENVELTE